MCNLSDVIEEKGIAKGIDKGRAEGKAEGLQEGLQALIDTVKDFVGNDFDKIAQAVRKNEKYANVSDEEIRKYLK